MKIEGVSTRELVSGDPRKQLRLGIIEKIDEPQKYEECLKRRVGNKSNLDISNHGHATLEELIEEEEEAKGGINTREFLIRIAIKIGGDEEVVWAVIDTGATCSCISEQFYNGLHEKQLIEGELPVYNVSVVVAVGRKLLNIKKQIFMEMRWKERSYKVSALVIPGLFTSIILGLNWLKSNKILIDCQNSKIYESKEIVNLNTRNGEEIATYNGVMAILKASTNLKEMIVRVLEEHQRKDKTWGKIRQNVEDNIGEENQKYCIHQGI